jgi:hypothetical protein
VNLTLVSIQVYNDCKSPGIEWKIIPTIEIRPHQQQGDDSIRGLVLIQNLRHRLQNNETNNKLQRYPHMKVNDVHKFDAGCDVTYYDEVQLEEIANGIQMDWISSLDISSPSARTVAYRYNSGLRGSTLVHFSNNCPLLEKVTYHNIKDISDIYMCGTDMGSLNNLKEIHMNNSAFYCENPDAHFIFYLCCKALERVSIRDAKLHLYEQADKIVPQTTLIRFVRNVSSLRWFRSDLTQENMDMLRLERPDIEFLN